MFSRKSNDQDLHQLYDALQVKLNNLKKGQDEAIQIDNHNEMIHKITDIVNEINEYQATTKLQENVYLKNLKVNANVGIWEAEIHEGDIFHPENETYISPELLDVLGLKDSQAPKMLIDIMQAVAPEHAEMIDEAVKKHFNDPSGRTPFKLKHFTRVD